jgi:hypothetical protein
MFFISHIYVIALDLLYKSCSIKAFVEYSQRSLWEPSKRIFLKHSQRRFWEPSKRIFLNHFLRRF